MPHQWTVVRKRKPVELLHIQIKLRFANPEFRTVSFGGNEQIPLLNGQFVTDILWFIFILCGSIPLFLVPMYTSLLIYFRFNMNN